MRIKEVGDQLAKVFSGGNSANEELRELTEYFRLYGPITFENQPSEKGGLLIAKSKNFRFGTIITSGRSPKEVDENIKDAILTAFEIPSAYLPEANLSKVGDQRTAQYATA